MDEFIKQLLDEKGLPANIDDKVRVQLEQDLTSRAVDFINRQLINSLTETQVAELEELIDEKPADTKAIQDFIANNVPNKEAITGAALAEFKRLYLGGNA